MRNTGCIPIDDNAASGKKTRKDVGFWVGGSIRTLCLALGLLFFAAACTQGGQSGSASGGAQPSASQSTVPESGPRPLKIFALNHNYTINLAMHQFKSRYPDTPIELELADWEGGLTYEDILIRLNTELLAGTGPDVLVLDGLPLQSYRQQGLLVDLADLVDTSGIYENLLEGFAAGGALPAVPTGLQFTTLLTAGGAEAGLSLDGLVQSLVQDDIDLGQMLSAQQSYTALAQGAQPTLWFARWEDVLSTLWNTCGAGAIQDNAVNRQVLQQLFSAFLSICQKLEITQPHPEYFFIYPFQVVSASKTADTSIIYPAEAYAFIAQWARCGVLVPKTMGDLLWLQHPHPHVMANMPAGGTTVSLFPGWDAGAWNPIGMLGISAHSQNPQAAALFIQQALGDKVQGDATPSVAENASFPVTKSGVQVQFQKQTKTIEAVLEETLDFTNTADGLISQLHTPVIVDDYVRTVVQEAAAALCAGSVDVDGAVAQVERYLEVYFMEKER